MTEPPGKEPDIPARTSVREKTGDSTAWRLPNEEAVVSLRLMVHMFFRRLL